MRTYLERVIPSYPTDKTWKYEVQLLPSLECIQMHCPISACYTSKLNYDW